MCLLVCMRVCLSVCLYVCMYVETLTLCRATSSSEQVDEQQESEHTSMSNASMSNIVTDGTLNGATRAAVTVFC